jgi:ABC-2 type transport system permease protein
MQEYMERMDQRQEIRTMISRISPATLYQEAASSLIQVTGISTSPSGTVISYGPGGVGQDILSNWPQIVVLAVVLVVCFAASYMLFLRQEIRAGG